MKMYSIKSAPHEISYFSVMDEKDGGYQIKICRDIDGYEKVKESFLTEELFDTCLRTGYIHEIADPAELVAV